MSYNFEDTWSTKYNLDLTAQTTIGAINDGNVVNTWNGKTWVKSNTANETTPAALTNGVGLVIIPTSSTDLVNTTATLPNLSIACTTLIPTFTLDTPVRFWTHQTANNASSNFEGAGPIMGNLSTNTWVVLARGFHNGIGGGTGLGNYCSTNYGGSRIGYLVPDDGSFSTNNVSMIEFPSGINGDVVNFYIGHYGTDWPDVSSMTNIVKARGQMGFSNTISLVASELSQWKFAFGARRAGSLTALSVTYAHIKVDTKGL